MREETVTLTTDGTGAAQADTTEPVAGEIYEVAGAAIFGGAGTLVVTRKEDGAVIYTGVPTGARQALPRAVANSNLHIVLAGVAFSVTGAVRIFWEEV